MSRVLDVLRGACGLTEDCADAAEAAEKLACEHCRFYDPAAVALCEHPAKRVLPPVPANFFCADWEGVTL